MFGFVEVVAPPADGRSLYPLIVDRLFDQGFDTL
jgi:hypothetical protein